MRTCPRVRLASSKTTKHERNPMTDLAPACHLPCRCIRSVDENGGTCYVHAVVVVGRCVSGPQCCTAGAAPPRPGTGIATLPTTECRRV